MALALSAYLNNDMDQLQMGHTMFQHTCTPLFGQNMMKYEC